MILKVLYKFAVGFLAMTFINGLLLIAAVAFNIAAANPTVYGLPILAIRIISYCWSIMAVLAATYILLWMFDLDKYHLILFQKLLLICDSMKIFPKQSQNGRKIY